MPRRQNPQAELFDTVGRLKGKLADLRAEVREEYKRAEKNADAIDRLSHDIADLQIEIDALQGKRMVVG